MIVFIVRFRVQPKHVDAFRAACIENARHSAQEPGVVRFELIQEADDPNGFAFVEVFRSTDAHARHRETAHYLTWRDTIADMMSEPCSAIKYISVFPEEAN